MLPFTVVHLSQTQKVSPRHIGSYGQNKMKLIKVNIEENVVKPVDSSAEELRPKTQVDCLKCKDFDKLVVTIKEKLSVPS